VTMMTDREKVYEALVSERIDNLVTGYFVAVNEAPHDAKEDVMLLDNLKDALGSLAMGMFQRGKDSGQLCPNCKQEIIDEAYLEHYGSICQKCGYDFLC